MRTIARAMAVLTLRRRTGGVNGCSAQPALDRR
jgi:hypothetical protein